MHIRTTIRLKLKRLKNCTLMKLDSIKDETGNNYDINTFAREVRKAVATICLKKDGVKPKVETPKVAKWYYPNNSSLKIIYNEKKI